MTLTLFITLLTVFSTATGLLTEGAKKILTEKNVKYSSNILACIIACIVGIGGTALYYVLFNIVFSLGNVLCMILMGISSATGAMVGYDKVMQAISQIKTLKS